MHANQLGYVATYSVANRNVHRDRHLLRGSNSHFK